MADNIPDQVAASNQMDVVLDADTHVAASNVEDLAALDGQAQNKRISGDHYSITNST